MAQQPVLIDGAWRQAAKPVGWFRAVDTTRRERLEDEYPVSSLAEVEAAIRAAYESVLELRSITPDQIADFLEAYASGIEARSEALVEIAYRETALPREPRLRSNELPRTTNQLRQAATAARSRSWCHATIDTQTNIRSKYAAMDGAVVVFGPNNFPFAFNSCAGGDFAAAIAAGNPVIAKANTGHPGTTRLVAEAALEAITACGMPRALVQLIYRVETEVGFRLVAHPRVAATGFTGSRHAGMALKAAADAAGKPIYLEMSSINPVYMLPGALEERADAIASEYAGSCLLGAGQFCTNPGFIVLLDSAVSETFLKASADLFAARPPGVLLSERAPRDLTKAITVMQEHGAKLVVGGREVQEGGYAFENTLLRVSGAEFLNHPDSLQTEAFGAVGLMVFARDESELLAITDALEGNLTGSIYSHSGGADDALYRRLEPRLRVKVGRLLNDKMPTGVAVSPAMNHGGPYPATGHPGFTAVGIPASMLRFAALHCYDNVRQERLPAELQDRNPTGRTWRLIDGAWTCADV
jgi:NADP-dependent aldehyde dehydrogenase